MSGDTIECFNCGHANPSWAQVCRQCGFALRPAGRPAGAPRGIFPTDQASLISIGGTLGAIVLAIGLGLFLSKLIPPAPNVATETATPTPSVTPIASASVAPSPSQSATGSVGSTPPLIGTLTFGTGLNSTTREVTGVTTTFRAGVAFAHSIKLTEPFGVSTIQEEVTRVDAAGVPTVVQARADGSIQVDAAATIAGFRVRNAATLIQGWGPGNFIMRVYRGGELLAEGTFTLS
jgi:hypothetical protein